MNKKLLTSLCILTLIFSISGCDSSGSQVEDYTLNFEFRKDSTSVELPHYEVAYLISDVDDFKTFNALTLEDDGTYSYTFSSISTGKHEYKVVGYYMYETVTSNNAIDLVSNSKGGYKTFRVKKSDNGSQTISTQLENSLAEYGSPNEIFDAIELDCNYKVTFEYSLALSREGITYAELLEDFNNLLSDEILASEFTLSDWKIEAYYTKDALLIADYYDFGYGLFLADYELMLNVDIEGARNVTEYVYDYYYFTDDDTWYYDGMYYGHWQDYWVSLADVNYYGLSDYFIRESSGLWGTNYTDAYSINNTSAAYVFFLLCGADIMFGGQENAELYGSYLTHDTTYFIVDTQELISNYYLVDISFDYYTEVDESGLPTDPNTTIYLYDEQALITISDVGHVNIDEAIEAASSITAAG